jgi:predicted DNA-binding protein
MKAMQIYISEEDHKKLKQIYTDTGKRITEIVRESIKEYLKTYDKINK